VQRCKIFQRLTYLPLNNYTVSQSGKWRQQCHTILSSIAR